MGARSQNPAAGDDGTATGIHCRLDELLTERGMTLTRLSELVGVSIVNLSVLKNNRAKAIRYSTLEAVCRVLNCDVGDLLVRANPADSPGLPSTSEASHHALGTSQ